MTTNQQAEKSTETTSVKNTKGKKQSSSKPVKSGKAANKTSDVKQISMTPAKPVEIIDKAKYSKRLEDATLKINKEIDKINSVTKSFCKIGHELYKVREQKLYLGLDYKNVAEYAEAAFQFQKSSTANYISICERFSKRVDGKPTAELLPQYSKFNYGQLSIMLSLPLEKVKEITPDTPSSEIREIKKQIKANSGSVPASAPVSGSSSGSGSVPVSTPVERLDYVISWRYKEEHTPIKQATITIEKNKADKIYKEICVLLSNDWYDFGRDGDSLTVDLLTKSGGDSN